MCKQSTKALFRWMRLIRKVDFFPLSIKTKTSACLVILLSLWLHHLSTAPACIAADTFLLQIPKTPVTITGFTRPKVEMIVTSEVSGRCLEVTADVGDRIKKSQPFIQIDPTFTRLDLQTNRLAQKKLEKSIQFNRQELKRYEKLFANSSVSQTRLDQIRLQYDISVIELENLVNAEKRLQEFLSRHTIKPPGGYQVIERYIEPGELVNVGQKLAKIGNFQELIIPLTLSFAEYKELQSRSAVQLFLPEAGLELSAQLYRITPGFDDRSRKIKVDLILPSEQVSKLTSQRGGLRVTIQLQLPDKGGSYIVPETAVQERHNYFWMTRTDGKEIRVVLLGKAPLDDHVLVGGEHLKAGEQYQAQPDK